MENKEPRLINPLYRIYLNLYRFMEYRNYDSKTKQLSEDDFLKHLHLHEYALIKAEGLKTSRIPDRSIYIFLIDENSEYGSSSSKFEMLECFIKKKKNEKIDMIVITKTEPSSHLKKKISAAKKKKTCISVYTYDNFKCVIPENPQVPKHEIIAKAGDVVAINEFLTTEKISDINQLPKIYESDSVSIWLGIKVGDIVQITGKSESAGQRVNYRICI